MSEQLLLFRRVWERNNPALLRRLLEHRQLDLVSIWPELRDEERQALVDQGYITAVTPVVQTESHRTWQDVWYSEHGASWPGYTLRLEDPQKQVTLPVRGWCFVGIFPQNQAASRWVYRHDDGHTRGLPSCYDGWSLRTAGYEDVLLPCWQQDGWYFTFDPSETEHAILQHVNGLDFGKEPRLEDVTLDHLTLEEGGYSYSAQGLLDIDLYEGGLAPYTSEEGARRYWVPAFGYRYQLHTRGSLDLPTTGIFPTREARDQILADYPVFPSQCEARAELWLRFLGPREQAQEIQARLRELKCYFKFDYAYRTVVMATTNNQIALADNQICSLVPHFQDSVEQKVEVLLRLESAEEHGRVRFYLNGSVEVAGPYPEPCLLFCFEEEDLRALAREIAQGAPGSLPVFRDAVVDSLTGHPERQELLVALEEALQPEAE